MQELDALPQTRLLKRSSLYRTAPEGFTEQPEFINAVAELQTALPAHHLLDHLLDIEHLHGRQRTFRNAPRTLDLDILLYGQESLHVDGLQLPHPRMHERLFVLLPLCEIAPNTPIPNRDTAQGLLAALGHPTAAGQQGSPRRQDHMEIALPEA